MLELTSRQFVLLCTARGDRALPALERYRRALREGPPPAAVGDAVAPIVRLARDDGTTKFVQRLPDGLEIESVLIPGRGRGERPRETLCVSSQAGCGLGCRFCETARMGLQRSLTVGEIVGQWFAARFELDAAIRNLVFMGMGEPMDNLDAVLQAIEVLTDRNGISIAPARITISTVGRSAGIERLRDFADRPGRRRLRLAVSINAPNDAVRRRIMPIGRAEPLGRLMDAMLAWTDAQAARRVMIGYVLIPGVNDLEGHAEELCTFLRPLPSLVNVIPYNPRRHSPWPAPSGEQVDAFTRRIAAAGQPVRRRHTKGGPVWAACGQLNPDGS